MSYAVSLPVHGVFEAWREAARRAISHRIAPERIDWTGAATLFEGEPLPPSPGPHQISVPRPFLALARSVVWHAGPERLALLYEALWRLDRREGDPLSHADPLGRRLALMEKAVRRDIHKMHAFVRFHEMPSEGPRRRFAAWFEPAHDTIEPGSAFFAARFADMDWMIVSPRLTARFCAGELRFGPGGEKPDFATDASGALWETYFANIFNPARIKLSAMQSEMPKKYWRNLPETRLIPRMIHEAEDRVRRMHEAGASLPRPGSSAVSGRYRAAMPQEPPLPETLAAARQAALQCQRCGLCEAATQTVFGEGCEKAGLMIVGEQPGDREDIEGRPFVGPAGRLLRKVMAQCGVEPESVWMTDAVKHFKFSPRGGKRLPLPPDRAEIMQCRWWLGLELVFVKPRVTLALGASAAFALTGDDRPLSARRGMIETGLHGGPVLISWHPSTISGLRDAAQGAAARRELEADLGAALALREAG